MRRTLLTILAVLLLALVPVLGTAHAAIGACGSDPVITFTDGQTLAIQPYVDTAEIAHVTTIRITVVSNISNAPTSVGSRSSNESVGLFSSSLVHGWQVQMIIDTDDGSTASFQYTATYRNATYTSALGSLNNTFWLSLLGSFNQDMFYFWFIDSVGSHKGNFTWNTTGNGDASLISSVATKIHLPTGSTSESASPNAGESVTFVNDQATGYGKGEFDVTPTSGNNCNEGGTFTIDSTQATFAGGACGTWDPATVPHFD